MATSCYLIDSSIYIFRYYFSSMPSHLSVSGREVSTVLAFTRWLLRLLVDKQPSHISVCFDESLGSCFRNDIDPRYKADRLLPDDDLAYELLACKKVCELLGLPVYASDRYEADDLIAALSQYAYAHKIPPIIITRDKDLSQLLQEAQGLIWDYGYNDPLGFNEFTHEFGIAPNRMAEYLAIAGDPVDNIVGVAGIGKKTVAALFTYFDSWALLKENIHTVETLPIRGAKRIGAALMSHVDLVEKNLQLTTLHNKCLDKQDICITRKEIDIAGLHCLLQAFQADKNIMKKIELL